MDYSDCYYDSDIRFEHFRTEKPDPCSFTMHTHDTNELLYFISGKGRYHVEGMAYDLRSGDIIITRRGESHYIEIDGNVSYERAYINFTDSLFSSIDPDGALMKVFYERDAGTGNRFSQKSFSCDIHIHLQNMIKQSGCRRTQILSGLLPLLNEINNVFETKSAASDRSETTLVSQIIGYINSCLNENISLDDICREFYISKSHLCRIFRQSAGATVGEYITVKRLMAAQEMLCAGGSPTKVYLNCGFNDYSVFFRAYKKRYGYPPHECLKNMRPYLTLQS